MFKSLMCSILLAMFYKYCREAYKTHNGRDIRKIVRSVIRLASPLTDTFFDRSSIFKPLM